MIICTGGDRTNSVTRGFIGPTTLTDRRGYYVRDGGAILVGHRGCRALVQEGPPLVFLATVLPVCIWC
jgi:hypothetical protein